MPFAFRLSSNDKTRWTLERANSTKILTIIRRNDWPHDTQFMTKMVQIKPHLQVSDVASLISTSVWCCYKIKSERVAKYFAYFMYELFILWNFLHETAFIQAKLLSVYIVVNGGEELQRTMDKRKKKWTQCCGLNELMHAWISVRSPSPYSYKSFNVFSTCTTMFHIWMGAVNVLLSFSAQFQIEFCLREKSIGIISFIFIYLFAFLFCFI